MTQHNQQVGQVGLLEMLQSIQAGINNMQATVDNLSSNQAKIVAKQLEQEQRLQSLFDGATAQPAHQPRVAGMTPPITTATVQALSETASTGVPIKAQTPVISASMRSDVSRNMQTTKQRLEAQAKVQLFVEHPWETIIDDVRIPYPIGVWNAPLEVAQAYWEWRKRELGAQQFQRALINGGPGGMIRYDQLNNVLGAASAQTDDWER